MIFLFEVYIILYFNIIASFSWHFLGKSYKKVTNTHIFHYVIFKAAPF